ncbi:hypothetical protein JL721_11928 [Aureococcus anophagefferens]|nr:hypothetical protein JL721_11928 [Aureococcus anophagefferens]
MRARSSGSSPPRSPRTSKPPSKTSPFPRRRPRRSRRAGRGAADARRRRAPVGADDDAADDGRAEDSRPDDLRPDDAAPTTAAAQLRRPRSRCPRRPRRRRQRRRRPRSRCPDRRAGGRADRAGADSRAGGRAGGAPRRPEAVENADAVNPSAEFAVVAADAAAPGGAIAASSEAAAAARLPGGGGGGVRVVVGEVWTRSARPHVGENATVAASDLGHLETLEAHLSGDDASRDAAAAAHFKSLKAALPHAIAKGSYFRKTARQSFAARWPLLSLCRETLRRHHDWVSIYDAYDAAPRLEREARRRADASASAPRRAALLRAHDGASRYRRGHGAVAAATLKRVGAALEAAAHWGGAR